MKMLLAILLSEFATQDETWAHHFDPESKMQSKQWKHPGSPHPKKLRVFTQQGADGLNLLG